MGRGRPRVCRSVAALIATWFQQRAAAEVHAVDDAPSDGGVERGGHVGEDERGAGGAGRRGARGELVGVGGGDQRDVQRPVTPSVSAPITTT